MNDAVRTLVLCCFLAHVSSEILDLNTKTGRVEWTLTNENGSISVLAEVPGGVYSDLMQANVIGDVFAEYNDVTTRWISNTAWTYATEFYVTPHQMEANAAQIVFHGLDTVAFVVLNGKPLLSADNMFIKYSEPAKKLLKIGCNTLNVTFDSAVKVANARSKLHFVAPECVPAQYHGECHVNQVRKMQASFGWDWGPAAPSVGIWKPVYIEFIKIAVIDQVTTHLKEQEDKWELKINVILQTGTYHSSPIDCYLAADVVVDIAANVSAVVKINATSDSDGTHNVTLALNVSKNLVSLWWPNGYGEQPLYPVNIRLMDNNSVEVSRKCIQIGFRTVELVQDNATVAGESEGLLFYFKVNGYSIFMKGSNWIPANILPEHTYNEDTVNHLLESAASAHMTMLRVWGGGVYESDHFYSKCDKLGILVWQDFMFACSMYPALNSFLRSVTKEVNQNVLRLQHHPSIAIWSGNNENEAALRDNWYQTKKEFSRYKDDYIRLYVHTIKPLVEWLDPGRQFLVSSPSNGKESEREGYVALNPYDSRFGDTHYYNYIADGWAMSTYPNTRFGSEYGFQSWPSINTLRSATSVKENLELGSEFMVHRQHLLGGDSFMKAAVDTHMLLQSTDEKYFQKLIYYSQISQAMSVKMETEYYRQSRTNWHTMGALYWQLNDVWQAPSWSSIEYGGRWKILHYFARDFFAPVLVSPRVLATGDIDVYVINDKLVPQENATLTVDAFKYDSVVPFATRNHSVYVGQLSATKTDVTISTFATKHNTSIFYRFSLVSSEGVRLSPFNYAFPVAFKMVNNIRRPTLTITVNKMNNPHTELNYENCYRIIVTTDTVILFFYLEAVGVSGFFTDNGMIVTSHKIHTDFLTNEDVDTLSLKNSLTIKYYYHSPDLTPVYS